MQRVPPASAPPGQRRAWPRPGFLVEQTPGGRVHRLLWETTIGRSTDSTTQVSINHPTVSFHHAAIRFEDNYFVVRDLQSKNGTFLLRDGREERVTTAPLRHGDIVRLGWDQPLSGPAAKPPPSGERGAVYLAFLDSAGHVQ
jgi:pSer/pThr/pTyr-binding forkhead associated (FHA) protein